LSASVISASKNVKASLDVPNLNAIILTNGLLRCNEFIRLQALAELAPLYHGPNQSVADSVEGRLEKSLKFEHRIEDTRSVRTVELRDTNVLLKGLKIDIVMSVAAILMGVSAIGLLSLLGMWNKLAYDFQVGNNQLMRVTVEGMGTDWVEAKSLDGKFRTTMGVDEFFSKCRNHPVIIQDHLRRILMLAVIIFVCAFLPSLSLTSGLREYWVNKKFRRLLALEEPVNAQAI
jgi:hypothetical protein